MKAGFQYVVSVYHDGDDWVADVLNHPGCSGVGDSPEEAMSTALSFIDGWVEIAKDRNQPQYFEVDAVVREVNTAIDRAIAEGGL